MNDPVLNFIKQKQQETDFENNIYYFCSHECHWSFDETMNAPMWYVLRLLETQDRIDKEQKKNIKKPRKK